VIGLVTIILKPKPHERQLAIKVFSIIELIEARDRRMTNASGRWFGNYETPTVLSKTGKRKIKQGIPLDTSAYGRKESEGKDFNEDTNFGKLKRIPHPALQAFLSKYHLTGDADETPSLLEVTEELREEQLDEDSQRA
jgi:hypothetical protein